MDQICKCLKCGFVGVRMDGAPDIHTFRNCNGQLEEVPLTLDEFSIMSTGAMIEGLHQGDEYFDFLRSMVELKKNDINEYNKKISEWDSQRDPKLVRDSQKWRNNPNPIPKINPRSPKCPNCNSVNVRKIDFVERAGSIAVFGLFSKKIGKSFKCKGCGYTW